MAVGLQTWNTAGEIQVDTQYINMFLRHAGVSPNGNGAAVTLPAIEPMVFIRPTGDGSAIIEGSLSGGNVTLRFLAPCEYYVFDKPTVIDTGLQCYTATGALCYTSAQKPLDIIDSTVIGNYFDASRNAYNDGYTYGGLPSGKYAYNVSCVRQGLNVVGSIGPVPYSVLVSSEVLTPTANGFFVRFAQQQTIPGWDPQGGGNRFVCFAPSVNVSIINVAGIL